MNEALNAIFHTVFFHRTSGKVEYKDEEICVIGSIGFEDVECQHLDLSYVRVNSPELANLIDLNITKFIDALRAQQSNNPTPSAQIALEFYQRKQSFTNRLFFSSDRQVWELWTIKVDIMPDSKDEENQLKSYATTSGQTSEIALNVCQLINQQSFVPSSPARRDLDSIFYTGLADAQPYLFRVSSINLLQVLI